MKRFLDFLKKHPIEIYYILYFMLVLFVMYGIYSCIRMYGCKTLQEMIVI